MKKTQSQAQSKSQPRPSPIASLAAASGGHWGVGNGVVAEQQLTDGTLPIPLR